MTEARLHIAMPDSPATEALGSGSFNAAAEKAKSLAAAVAADQLLDSIRPWVSNVAAVRAESQRLLDAISHRFAALERASGRGPWSGPGGVRAFPRACARFAEPLRRSNWHQLQPHGGRI